MYEVLVKYKMEDTSGSTEKLIFSEFLQESYEDESSGETVEAPFL
jgi:hypothetical protein